MLREVQRLKQLYPTYSVKTTGHSLGGALALLTQLDLIKDGFEVTMYNFGQPRVGDKKFAAFAYSKAPSSYRVVHYQDPVPHLPNDTFPLWFKHSCTEIYEDKDGSVKTCSQTECEDPTCSDKWHAWRMSPDDHDHYLGHDMFCSTANQ